jgi:hypothetical protein
MLGDAWQRFSNFTAMGGHAVDVMNRASIAKAAYDLELRRTGDAARARDYAVEMARQTMPNYGAGNKARIATAKGPLGVIGSPLFQFKNYGLHMYSVLSNLAQQSMKGASREERWEARKAFAGLLATHSMMAGVLTLIADPLRYIGGAYDLATGASKPHDYQNDVRGWMADTFGPELAEVMARGLPHAIGMDVHRRVGLANLLEIPEMPSFDAAGAGEMIAGVMTGATGENLANIVDGLGKLARGDVLGGVQAAIPRPIRDVIKAGKLATQGVTDSKHRPILPAEKLSGWDVGLQAVGFQPSKITEFREGRAAVLEAETEAKDMRSRLTNAWITADPEDRGQVMAEIQRFNGEHPAQRITVSQLMRNLAQLRKQGQNPAAFGLRLPRKGAQDFMEAGRFATP